MCLYMTNIHTNTHTLVQSARAVEYNDCTRVRLP